MSERRNQPPTRSSPVRREHVANHASVMPFGRLDPLDLRANRPAMKRAGVALVCVCGREFAGVPLLANMVEFGKTPRVEVERLKKWGFDVAIYPGLGFSVAAEAMRQAWEFLKDKGTSSGIAVPQFKGMHELMGFPDVWDFEKKWAQ